MIRLNLKLVLLVVCGAVAVVTLSFWSRCGEVVLAARGRKTSDWDAANKKLQVSYIGEGLERGGSSDLQGYEEIDCHINGEYNIGCRKEGGEIYVPFSFIHKYFEIYGKLAAYDGYERFEWSHSYSKVYYPKGKYDPRGVFMYFENYNVEVRDRVKCVSATEGVPVSTQWESQGYYYPTQIAQFGLSHYSKNLTEPEPRHTVLEDAEHDLAHWVVATDTTLSRDVDPQTGSHILQFSSPDGVSLRLDHVLDFVLSVNLRLSVNSSLSVTLQSRETRDQVFQLHYICSELLISAQDRHVYHGIGPCGLDRAWRRLTRDLVVDLHKGLAYQNRPRRKFSRSKLKVIGLTFRGAGQIDNVTLSTSEHLAQFYDAAQWLVNHQDASTGGWPNPVRRRVAPGMADLEPGWYSAMGQGHALSVLARAYHHSGGESSYLQAALAGLRPFDVASSAGGVLASFLEHIPWYEEYPTQPASFVLNGFIYALLGLYDLSVVAPASASQQASQLFKQGMTSLKQLLLLYDTGSGTTYDLRHFTLGTAPNLARWDYHATHVNQLLLLATIDPDPLLAATAERWIGYMSGKRAAHN